MRSPVSKAGPSGPGRGQPRKAARGRWRFLSSLDDGSHWQEPTSSRECLDPQHIQVLLKEEEMNPFYFFLLAGDHVLGSPILLSLLSY